MKLNQERQPRHRKERAASFVAGFSEFSVCAGNPAGQLGQQPAPSGRDFTGAACHGAGKGC